REWYRFIYDVSRLAVGNTYSPRVVAEDARTTKRMVYTNADVDYAVQIDGSRREDVVVVGNPDLERFGVTESDIGCVLGRSTADADGVMYIETGFALLGLYFANMEAFVDHLRRTAEALNAQGKKMYLRPKPNPGGYFEMLQKNLADCGVEVVS